MQPQRNLGSLIEVIISNDKLAADLVLKSDEEEVTVSVSELKELLRQKGVVYGIDDAALTRFAQQPRDYLGVPLRVATGKAPEPGSDARIEYAFERREEKRPKELDDGRVDYYSVVSIANVSRGQLLAQKIPAGKGVDGVTVTGQPLAAKPGKDAVIKPGKNVVLNEDKTLLYALIDGQVSFSNDKVSVFPVYEVKGDVDFSVGNIDFVGTVVIRGNVPTGFHIKASGDIRIYGSVEGAELEAGGLIEIKSGIVAQDKGHVIAGTNVVTSYIQNGNVTAGNDVIVSQSIMFSNVRAGKNVLCNGPKGIIIGGTIQAGERIVARVIGNSTATPTVLEVGVKPQMRNELQQVITELQGHYDNLKKTDQGLGVLNHLLQTGKELPPEKKMLQIKLTNTRLILEKEIKQLETRKKELEQEIGSDSLAVVDVYQVMYPGIKLVFGKLVRFIKQEFPRTRFHVLHGEITASPLV